MINNSTLKLIFSLTLACIMSACAAGLDRNIRVSVFDESAEATANNASSYSDLKVSVQPFADIRREKAIGSYNGEDLQPDGNIGLVVQKALEQKMRQMGAKAVLFNAPTISGEVKEWFVNVRSEFPAASVEAHATLNLNLTDQDGRVLYRGSYAGEYSEKSPIFSQSRIEQILAMAMNESLNQALTDPDLLASISQR